MRNEISNEIKRASWIICPRPKPEALVRLFCFPYAGGGVALYRRWEAFLPANVEICFVQLPGRENRLNEAPFTRLTPLIQASAQAILPYLEKPFAFFGHSMGAFIAFELTRYLRKHAHGAPIHLFVSGARAPQLPDRHAPIHHLPQAAFLEKLRMLNGTPEEVLRSEELLQIVLPTLRADFAVCETYVYEDEEPLTCPLSAFGGLYDQEVNREELQAWHQQTQKTFSLAMFPGDHFYLHNAQELLLQSLLRHFNGQWSGQSLITEA